jgi:MHS family proline/betaine transporter-like MFS transporter
VLGAAAVGNLLEWYDWGVYGFLITYIGLNFFPSSSSTATLMMTFAAFGAGFLMRPVGAIAAGWIGETRGRKDALLVTLLVMAAGTAPIAFIPSYQSIGIWAPMLLLLCRLLQGLSTGGELGGSLAFLAEWAPARHRGFYVSLQQASTHGGTLLGSAVAASLNAVLTPEQMTDWGWRLPFLAGGALLPVALWLRFRVDETPYYLAARRNAARSVTPPVSHVPKPSSAPVAHGGAYSASTRAPADSHDRAGVTQAHGPASALAARGAGAALGRKLATAIGLIAAPVACQYLFFTYLATFAVRYGGLTEAEALGANSVALAMLMICTPIMGAASDRIGRRPLLLAASGALLLAAAPAFACVASSPGMTAVLCLQAALAIVVSMFHGAGPAAVTELFPTQGRALLVSIAYGLGVALAGGFAPFIAIWLIEHTGSTTAPALYIAAACAVTAWAAARMPETAQRSLA